MLRSRDIIAILLAVWIIRLANQEEKAITAALHLAFYTHATIFATFDVDGDGTVEALAIVRGSEQQTMLEILDLKPLHSNNKFEAAPFHPKTMLKARIAQASSTKPLKIATGQIMVRHRPPAKKVDVGSGAPADLTDRTRRYFCGSDWHDASEKCATPCPGGTPGECPGEEKCYADTPCDALAAEPIPDDSEYQLTPAGSLPSVATLWDDGTVRMHSVTATNGEELQLKEMWAQTIPLGVDDYDIVVLGDQDFSSTSSKDGQLGVVLIGGTRRSTSVIHALDVMTGKILWNSETPQVEDLEGVPDRGTSSVARRRSRLLEGGQSARQDLALPNCWDAYRHSMLAQGMKPFWGATDAKWHAVHLDRRNHKKKKKKQVGRKWHHRHIKPIHGRPNALLLRHQGGIQVRSLKNGRALCHLSLLDHVVYGDLNRDGTLDQVQAITSSEEESSENQAWIDALAKQVEIETSESNGRKRQRSPRRNKLCHLLALSGLPAREQLFSASLCPGNSVEEDVSAAAPLITPTNQVIVALSNGMVSKHDSKSGQRIWQHYGHEGSPTWHPSSDAAMVASLYPSSSDSPVLLACGENGMSVLTGARGTVLATATFPQATSKRPVVEDWSGDGTPDALIATPDAVWGYRILVRRSGTASRIAVGLLLVAIALALLRNRFGNNSNNHQSRGKRSTDK